ncbi:MAG: DUF5615 family PIN-like protein [Planctomycetes bacterium]|nr:DUF5615 family PIN-like protein [Planctomycetota bacterium]
MGRFLVDEDCPRSLAPALRAAGHDALDVRDADLRGAPDDRILSRACADSRILIAADTGFGNILLYSPSGHRGIFPVSLPESVPARQRVEMILEAVASLEREDAAGLLAIIEAGRIRLRR